MPYQNNNNRLTPDAAEDRKLKPAATPTDKSIKYAIDTSESAKWTNAANALASLGKGIMEMDVLWHYQSQENAIKAIAETEAQGGNKKDWAEVSKNIKGAAIFNPYNDDAFRKIQADDIYRAAAIEASAHPELEKMDEQAFNKTISDTQQKMIEAFKEAKLEPKDYAHALIQWHKQADNLTGKYLIAHKEYQYKQLAIKQASDLSFNAGAALMETNGLDKSIILRDTINSKLAELNELGMPADTQAGIILSGMRGFLTKNADKITGAEFKAAIADLEIGGQKVSELVADYDYKAEQLYKEASRAIYEDKQLAYKEHQLDLQIASDNAVQDLYKWTQENPKAKMHEVLAKTQEIVKQYGLEEEGFTFINQMSKNMQTIQDFDKVETDDSVMRELTAKYMLGTLTPQEISDAVINKEINWNHALQLDSKRLAAESREQAAVKSDKQAVKTAYNDLQKKIKKNGIYYNALGERSPYIKEANDTLNNLIVSFGTGEISLDEATKGLQQIERILKAQCNLKDAKNKNDKFLVNADYIKTLKVPSSTQKEAEKVFKTLGIYKGSMGQNVKPQITSMPKADRTINGETKPHWGYDVTGGKAVHSADRKGTVIYAGYLKDFGNYAVIKYDNGYYMRVGHLATSTSHLQGTTIEAGAFLGREGNTGNSTGQHTHYDFWNRNKEIISIEAFEAGMRGR